MWGSGYNCFQLDDKRNGAPFRKLHPSSVSPKMVTKHLSSETLTGIMGAGASTSSSPAVVAACTVLFKEIRVEYEGLIGSNASPEKVVEFINAQGARLQKCATAAATAESRPNNSHTPVQRGLPKGPGLRRGISQPQKNVKGGKNRRRSYGNNDMEKFTKVGGGAPVPGGNMAESASVPTLDAVEAAAAAALNDAAAQLEQMKAMNAETVSTSKPGEDAATDHWDSVRDLPFCEDCQMAFKSMSALTRHVKYSNLHESTIAKKKAAADAANGAETAVETKKAVFLARQEEGKDFRLLYFGSKFFWRTQDNIDLSFYQHIMTHIIEVIPFDVHKNKEMKRIYLDKFAVDTMLDSDVKAACAKKKDDLHNEAAKSKFTVNVDFDEDAEYHAMQRVLCTSFILTRLNLQEMQDGKKHWHQLLFHSLNSDSKDSDPLLKDLPESLVPVSVTHRRNSSAEEVKAKLEEVNISQDALRVACGKAEKVSSMVHNFIKMTSASKILQNMNPARKRFVMAARKVMQINGVERTKKHLNMLAEKNSTQSPTTRRRKLIGAGTHKEM